MNIPSIIPFRVNKAVNAKNSLVNNDDYFVTESKKGYMCTVEYIALEKARSVIEFKVSVYDFNSDEKGKRVLGFEIPVERTGTFFTTKIRMQPGEKLNIKAIGTDETVTVHISGYYELIPQI